ncbi:MAG: hypothetical protein OEZ22_09210 [Spirochaetia bacterium]|nr:hypothetical protein [Spirochaetia bacterium]
MRKKTIVFLLGFIITSSSISAADKKIELLSFTVAPVLALQENGWAASGIFDFTPRYNIKDNLYFTPNIGLGILLNKKEDYFPLINAEMLIGIILSKKYSLEAGGGMQIWYDNGGINPAFSANFLYYPSKQISVINRFFFGYTIVSLENIYTHEIRIGVGIKLGK